MGLSRKRPLGAGRKALERGSSFRKPRGRLKSKPRATTPDTPSASRGDERHRAAAFERAVKAPKRCGACGHVATHPRMELDAHHVIPKSLLKRVERERGLAPGVLVWDPANGMPLCSERTPNRCHDRHTLAVARVPRDRVPAAALRFAARLGMMHIIERHYPVTEPSRQAQP